MGMDLKRDLDIALSVPARWEKLRGRTLLVTGAAGRIGRWLVFALEEAGRRFGLNLRVLALVRRRGGIEAAFGAGVEILEQDVAAPIAIDGRVDYILHAAGWASPADFALRPAEAAWGHLQGARSALELARRAGTRRVLYVSTAEVYGDWTLGRPAREEDMGVLRHRSPRACYPEAKRMGEAMLAAYRAEYGIDSVTVRLSHVVGPGISLTDGRAFAEFIRHALRGEDILLRSDGRAVRSYTYAADAVGAMLLALLNGREDCYNVEASGNRISTHRLARLIAALAPNGGVDVKTAGGADDGLRYLPFRLAMMDAGRIEALGWRARVGLADALRWTMESFEDG